MTNAYLRNRIALAATGLAVLTLGACVSEMPRFPSEPSVLAFNPMFTRVNTHADRRGVSNGIKYRDTGGKPVSGRTGSASMEVRALLGASGATVVEATTGSFENGPDMARFDKVLLMVPNTALTPVNDRPQSRAWSHAIQGLTVADQIEFHGNIRLASMGRIEVIRVTTAVMRRPDLVVSSLSGPERAFPHIPVNFVATVREANGDMGARANCVLYVNDVAVDQAVGVWVDALDVVSCQFSHIFQSVGMYSVAVALTSVDPGDWDTTNNRGSTTIAIVPPGTPIEFGTLSVGDEGYTYTFEAQRTGDYPVEASYLGSQMLSYMNFDGNTPLLVAAPVQRAEVRVSADGAPVHASDLTELVSYRYDDGFAVVDCADFFETNESMQACTARYRDESHASWFTYAHSTGAVTYYGQTVHCHTLGCNTYTTNINRVSGSGLRYGVSANSVMRVELSFVDAVGHAHTVDRSVTFDDYSAPVNYDRSTCSPYFDGLGTVCTRRTSTGTVWRGVTRW